MSEFDATKLSNGELILCLEEMRRRDAAEQVATAPDSCRPHCFDETDCSNVAICNAIEEAYEPDENGWTRVGPGTPIECVLETRRDGENGTNLCFCRIMSIGDEPEWIEKAGGRTTVTHSTFAAPTHWRWPDLGKSAKGASVTMTAQTENTSVNPS